MSKFLIAIEGNIGCGKDVFIKFLQKYFKDSLSYSENQIFTWDNEELIKNFYKDQERWSFIMEVSSIIKKIKNLLYLITTERNKIIISTRCPSSDRDCFLKTLYKMKKINSIENSIFQEMFDMLKMPKFNVIIYLKSDIDSCFQRIISKKRESEKKLSFEFIKKLHNSYEEWIINLKKNNINVVIIDMELYSELDGDEQIEENVLNIILKEIPLLKNYLRWIPYKKDIIKQN